MHLWRLWIALGLFASFAAAAAVVYKWTDSAGVVHFSDQPVPGAERIVTSSPATGVTSGAASAPAPTPKAGGGLHFNELSVDSPSPEQVFFNDDVVSAHLRLDPGLKDHQRIIWHLNGRPLDDQAPDAVNVTLQTLPRGTYAIDASVTDLATGETQGSNSVTFYVRQPSELAPQHKKS